MEIRSQEEVLVKIEDCAREILKLQSAKKKIDEEIKEIKQAYKEDGIAVGLVNKAINEIKKMKKQSASEQFELDIIIDRLSNNKDIDDSITEIIAK